MPTENEIYLLNLDTVVQSLENAAKPEEPPKVSTFWKTLPISFPDEHYFLDEPIITSGILHFCMNEDPLGHLCPVLYVRDLKGMINYKLNLEVQDFKSYRDQSDVSVSVVAGLLLVSVRGSYENTPVSHVRLLALRLNKQDQRIDPFAAKTLTVPNGILMHQPIFPDDRVAYLQKDRFFEARGRTFSMVFLSKERCAFWIHCLHRPSFLPVGRGTVGLAGLWTLNAGQTLVFDTEEALVSSFYSVQRKPQDSIYVEKILIKRIILVV